MGHDGRDQLGNEIGIAVKGVEGVLGQGPDGNGDTQRLVVVVPRTIRGLPLVVGQLDFGGPGRVDGALSGGRKAVRTEQAVQKGLRRQDGS